MKNMNILFGQKQYAMLLKKFKKKLKILIKYIYIYGKY